MSVQGYVGSLQVATPEKLDGISVFSEFIVLIS